MKITKEDSEKYDTVYVEQETSKHNKMTIGTVYRPPKQQAADDAALYDEIHTITQNRQSVIIGNFDCSNIDWTTMHGDREGNRLLEMLEDTFLTQIVTQPTRENNSLDLVLVSDSNLTRECQVGEKLDGCDHHLIRLKIRTDHELTENTSKIPDYKRANFKLARDLLTQTTLDYTNLTPVEGAWNGFKNKLIEVEGTTVPMKTRRTNNAVCPPWITTHVRRAINKKMRKYNLLRENSTDEARRQYHQSLRACRTFIRQRKRNYEKQIAREAKSNPKKVLYVH